ncbi:MAG: DUF3857 domain-containing protein [Flavobacterium sp.]|uniref:DUF3857 domain-containing protein n=1 Tax=Flavobacterium sp. TaxID=239 RepID=UPI0011F8263B|nr:DUF3857 domain-containing protein [Flavobacterium sp.]RZJ66477.1 MAG: DUF3857 domain-containing protein [Flavobacterium sp.]
MRKIIYFILLLTFSANAQYKLGKVTVDELKEKVCPTDTSAAAAILFKKADISWTINPDGYWNVVTETKVKIKIYKKEGYKYANHEESYYTGTNSDRIDFDDAATYNLVDGKVEKTKLKSEGEFTEKTAESWKTKKISLPNVKEGSIIEYSVRYTTYRLTTFGDFYFQYDVPVNYIEYRVATPEDYEYNRFLGGYLQPEQKDEKLLDVAGRFNQFRTTFSMSNVKAMKDEDYVNNIDNYRSHVTYELSSKKNKGFVEKLATDWASVSKNIYEDEDFGPQLRKDSYFEEDLKVILDGAKTPDEKMNVIFKFVQSRMVWNERNSYYCRDGVKTAYKNKTGNVAEINLMLTAMLRYGGLTANPVILSTRANGIALFPSRTAFNYVIAAVETPQGQILLDATSKNSLPNVLPFRVLNWNGRIIRKDGTSAEVNLMPDKNSKEVVNLLATIDSKGSVSGQMRDIYSDYNAYSFRENYSGVAKESYLEKLEKRYNGISVNDYSVQNDRELEKPVMEAYTFTHDNVVEVIGDRIYFSPMLFLARENNPFKQEVREYPVDFGFPYQDRYSITINLPDGYVVESTPSPGLISTDSNIGSFKYNIASNGKQIQLSIVHDMNFAVVSQQHYETLKMFYREMIAKQNEKIVLRKS